jgi:hypothetical protein
MPATILSAAKAPVKLMKTVAHASACAAFLRKGTQLCRKPRAKQSKLKHAPREH